MQSTARSSTMSPEGNREMRMDKQKAFGSIGDGSLFDSGCNLSGVLRVHMDLGLFEHHDLFGINKKGDFTLVDRIFLEFETPTHSQTGSPLSPSYAGLPSEGPGIIFREVFEVPQGDQIVRIDVWASSNFVHALQFHTKSGTISELYGMPYSSENTKNPMTVKSFQAKDPNSSLVGLHGSLDGAVKSLGFTFASTVNNEDTMGFPPMEEETPSVDEHLEEHAKVRKDLDYRWEEVDKHLETMSNDPVWKELSSRTSASSVPGANNLKVRYSDEELCNRLENQLHNLRLYRNQVVDLYQNEVNKKLKTMPHDPVRVLGTYVPRATKVSYSFGSSAKPTGNSSGATKAFGTGSLNNDASSFASKIPKADVRGRRANLTGNSIGSAKPSWTESLCDAHTASRIPKANIEDRCANPTGNSVGSAKPFGASK